MSSFNYVVVSDGGAKRNGSQDAEAYGSYKLVAQDGREALCRFTFPTGDTNNQAEYKALILALADLSSRISKAGRKPGNFTVQVKTDSNLVVTQLRGEARCRAGALVELHRSAGKLIQQFKAVELVQVPRAEVAAILGH